MMMMMILVSFCAFQFRVSFVPPVFASTHTHTHINGFHHPAACSRYTPNSGPNKTEYQDRKEESQTHTHTHSGVGIPGLYCVSCSLSSSSSSFCVQKKFAGPFNHNGQLFEERRNSILCARTTLKVNRLSILFAGHGKYMRIVVIV